MGDKETARIQDDIDRERGIFTPRDRKFLAGVIDDDLSPNARRQKRYRLRERMVHALQDLRYLRLMSTKDVGQLAEQFGFSDNPDLDFTPSSDPDFRERSIFERRLHFTSALREVLALARELFDPTELEFLMKDRLGEQAALDYYEETGRFGVFEVTLDVERVDEMSIEELRNVAYDDPPARRNPNAPPGAFEVLDLHGVEPPSYDPEHPALADVVIEVITDLGGESEAVGVRRVLNKVAEQEDVSIETAQEAYDDVLCMGECYEPDHGAVRMV